MLKNPTQHSISSSARLIFTSFTEGRYSDLSHKLFRKKMCELLFDRVVIFPEKVSIVISPSCPIDKCHRFERSNF